MIFSCIIPASKKDADSQNLKDLIASIRAQDFSQDEIEILVETEGDSEQAKANGIRKAAGEICGMFCADNQIMEKDLFERIYYEIRWQYRAGVYPGYYYYSKDDNSLNRYFSLMGGNDPVCWFLGKNDRWPYCIDLKTKSKSQPSYGCNGFFYRTSSIRATDLDHYYPMDNAMEVKGDICPIYSHAIWHKTSDALIPFLIKRYKYARDLYSDRNDRRWKMLGTKEDYIRLGLFILSTLAVIPCLWVSIKGFCSRKDWAWFWHWPVCFGFLVTYAILAVRNCLQALSSRQLGVRNLCAIALSPYGPKTAKTTKS